MIAADLKFVLRENYSVLSASDGIERLLGYRPEDFISGKVTFMGVLHPDDQDIAAMLFSRDPPRALGRFNIRLRHINGRIVCVRGEYDKYAGLAEGEAILELWLQDAKYLSRTLNDASMTANFRAMMENTDDYIYFKDRNHVFTGASQTLVTLCDPAEHWTDLLGKTDYDVFPEAFADIYYRLEKQVFAGVPVAHEVQETLTKVGKKGWVDNRKYPIFDAVGEIVGLYGIARDITEQRQVEDSLRASEERLRLALAAANQGWFDVDFVSGEINVSPEYARMLGYQPDEFQSDLANWFAHVHPEERPKLQEAFNDCLRSGGPQTMEYRRQTQSGDWKWLRSVGQIVQWDAEQRATRMIGIHTDITERKLAEIELENHRHHLEDLVADRTKELLAAKDAAEAANRAKSTFLANMGHELRTPMNAIMGMTNLVLRKLVDPKQRDQLTRVTEASQQLLAIINDILDISKIEAERVKLAQVNFGLDEVMAAVVSQIGQKAMDKALHCSVEMAPGMAELSLIGDSLRLQQILLNLSGNALKFTEQGSVNIRARLQEESSRDVLLRFEVEDTGIGISAEHQKRLFTAFEQADSSLTRKYGGSGLGLAISKRLVALMGGDIGVESTLGQGSLLWFTVPLDKASAASAGSGAIQKPGLPLAEALAANECAVTPVLLVRPESVSQDELAIDLEKLRQLCVLLAHKLNSGDFACQSLFEDNQLLLRAALGNRFPKMAKAMHDYDFVAALDGLKQGAAAQGVEF